MSHNGWELNPIPERSDQKAACHTCRMSLGIQQIGSGISPGAREFAHRGADSDAVFGFWGAYERRFRRDAA